MMDIMCVCVCVCVRAEDLNDIKLQVCADSLERRDALVNICYFSFLNERINLWYHHSVCVPLSLCRSQLTDFHEILYDRYGIGGHPSWITT
jgi:hypothetical protein